MNHPARTPRPARPTRRRRRVRWGDDRGSVVVTTVVLMVTLTGGALIWLTRDVDRQIAAVSQANAVALQAARAGAQRLTPASLRGANTITIDRDTASRAATATASNLLDANHTVGRVETVLITGDRITVTVSITEAGRTVTGQATAHATAGVTQAGD